jgi:hypothetical protein
MTLKAPSPFERGLGRGTERSKTLSLAMFVLFSPKPLSLTLPKGEGIFLKTRAQRSILT